ncbi:chitin synthase-domain-containing protein [Gamsiella multidivaricata]|uniref:chitin synthase-domain-containing protein n=1 Tax=Gamsiella multidivaricata TaxID=101098 RepID=UPI0022200D53|nr:chitin synthase-domain-containing protein [Gamsiella multidivaricata]KAI7818854.1 chitin synthase-domain-containing protein [Gamsiella multidivaricata]
MNSSDNENAVRGGLGPEREVDSIALDDIQSDSGGVIDDASVVHSGHYVIDARRVPYILVIRPPRDHLSQPHHGNWEKKKLVVRWLHRVCFNQPISALEYDLFERVRDLNHHGPGIFEMLLMTEVGSVCDRHSVTRLVDTLENNERVIGASGQGMVENSSQNWLTWTQDYEHHLSLQFTNAFESTTGAVQCLPSRFSLVRIKVKLVEYAIPVLVHPDVVSSYVDHRTHTLHDRSLVLDGGEDRYLTGLLHSAFPDRRIVYQPYATYGFTVTADLSAYLLQQRLLLTSSFHTYWVQMWSPRLRGVFCCSINCLAMKKWLKLVLGPAMAILTCATLVIVVIGAVTNVGALYSLPTVLALAFMLSATLLQPILGVCLGRRTILKNVVGFCMYMVTLPCKSIGVALLAYWHLDGKFL